MFIIALFIVSHIWKQPKCLSREQINCGILYSIKINNIHTDMANFIDKIMNSLDLNSIEILLEKFISKIK